MSSEPWYAFASDNTSGLIPEVWAAMRQADEGYLPSYGNDDWTRKASNRFREIFETGCEVFFVLNGTAANSLALASLCSSYHSVICHESAHIETDECGAPEFYSGGAKLLLASGDAGKMKPEAIEHLIMRRTDIHYPKPKVLSLTQSTELGTVWSPEEIRQATGVARKYGLQVHMDGARFPNAIAALDCSPADATWKAGVDVLCFGGTKNGLGAGEAVVFFDKDLAEEFDYRCKQAGQLASKMRYLSAPWLAFLTGDTWLRHASHANRQAARLAQGLQEIAGINLTSPVEANAVFFHAPELMLRQVRSKGWFFYDFIGGSTRLMCSWKTTDEEIQILLNDFREAAESTSG